MKKSINDVYIGITKNDEPLSLDISEINEQDEKDDTLLHFAIREQNEKAVKILGNKNINPLVRNKNGMSGMTLAASYDNVNILNYLIQTYIDMLTDVDKSEMLACSVIHNLKDNVECMISHKFNPLNDFRGDPIIIWAIQSEDLEMIKLLVNHGSSINASNDEGHTLLYNTAAEGLDNILKWLIEMGADIEKKDHKGNTPLIIACCYNQLRIVELLVEHGANTNAKNNRGCSPLLYAVKHADIDIVKLLVHNGADVSAKDMEGKGINDYLAKISDGEVKKMIKSIIVD